MQVILDSLFARQGSAPIGGGKKGEFTDWTNALGVGDANQNPPSQGASASEAELDPGSFP